MLYIFCFLHQTTTKSENFSPFGGCISFVFYIKPQHINAITNTNLVVYLLFSTSNHNSFFQYRTRKGVVYLLFSTSNHNAHGRLFYFFGLYIFCFLHQTTTLLLMEIKNLRLYIFCFLHQTTTTIPSIRCACRCISFVFYIKPQLADAGNHSVGVVYLLFSTSNHNQTIYILVIL